MREKGIIIQDLDEDRGHYKFVNELYFLYIVAMSFQYKADKSKK